MPYAESGNLLTESREINTSDEWSSQIDWEANQEANGVVIENGTVMLVDLPIPVSGLLHYYPGDEGSGSTLTDNVGGADMSINGPSWVSNPDFYNGSGLSFDGGYCAADPDSTAMPTERTRFIRVIWEGEGETGTAHNRVFQFGGGDSPFLAYHTGGDRWDYRDGIDGTDLEVDDPLSSVDGAIRILVCRMESDTQRLDVYDADKNQVAGESRTNPDESYEGNELHVGGQSDGTRYWVGEIDPMFLTYNYYMSDSEVDDVLEAF